MSDRQDGVHGLKHLTVSKKVLLLLDGKPGRMQMMKKKNVGKKLEGRLGMIWTKKRD